MSNYRELYDTTITQGSSLVVVFRVGRVVKPSAEDEAALDRISALLNRPDVLADIKRIREWSGNVVLYGMRTRVENPEVTEEMEQAFKQIAGEMYPDHRVVDSWVNSMYDIRGYSVRLSGGAA